MLFDLIKKEGEKIITLPHPSPANVGKRFSWHPKDIKNEIKIKKRITSLIEKV